MKKSLLMTTALVALTAATNVYAEDEHITDDITISENVTINEDNAANYATTGNISVTGGEITASGDAGLIQLSDGNKKTLSISGGELIFSNGAGIYAEGVDGQYSTTAADMNIGGNANITMDYTGVAPDNEHDGGILHEGQSGNLNISGGVINLTGEVAKIERSGYDGDWIYSKSGETKMSEEEFYQKTGKWFEGATDDDIKTAGLNPDEIDKNQYHVSNGNINITGGEINLKDVARISLTEKNTGDLNISGNAVINSDNGGIANIGSGNINILGGTSNLNNPNSEFKQTASNGQGIFGSNVSLTSADKVNIFGGKVNLNQTSINGWKGIEISGGEVNLGAENIGMISTLWSKGDILLSGGTINTNGAAINTFYLEDGVDSKGTFNIWCYVFI